MEVYQKIDKIRLSEKLGGESEEGDESELYVVNCLQMLETKS